MRIYCIAVLVFSAAAVGYCIYDRRYADALCLSSVLFMQVRYTRILWSK